MKALVVFLASVVLLCVVLLVRNSFARDNYVCSGPYMGCTFEQCVRADGNCPSDADNIGVAYNWASFSPVSVYSCTALNDSTCDPNAVSKPFCSVIAYNTPLPPPNNCINATCFFLEYVNQCPTPP